MVTASGMTGNYTAREKPERVNNRTPLQQQTARELESETDYWAGMLYFNGIVCGAVRKYIQLMIIASIRPRALIRSVEV